jgi:polyphosphate glucokinase
VVSVENPLTLCIDIGGTRLKAALVDSAGALVSPRVRADVIYPMEPSGENGLVPQLVRLVAGLPAADLVSVGFPGRVSKGVVLTGAKFTGGGGPGSAPDPTLTTKWQNFNLQAALVGVFGLPVRVANDADVQGTAVVSGKGFEVVITLGTGLGSALFEDGVLLPHLELAHQPFRKEQTYEEQLGEAARLVIGDVRWNRRVAKALGNFTELFAFDKLYLGGGNSKKVDPQTILSYGDRVATVDNMAGILGGVRLWRMPEGLFQ